MKLKITVTLIIIATFLLLTFIFSENSAMADGDDLIGFPFYFYRYTEGKLTNQAYKSYYGFFPTMLLYDILILAASIILANVIAIKFKLGKPN